MNRKSTPRKNELAVLTKSKRRCALCFHLDFNVKVQKGQIAHIDHNPENCEESNLVFLCLAHHAEYDSRTSQNKGITQRELKQAKTDLEQFIASEIQNFVPPPEEEVPKVQPPKDKVSIELYRVRLPVYHAFRDFAVSIVRDAEVKNEEVFRFLAETHEALFLYDEEMESFLKEVFSKAAQLRSMQGRMQRAELYTNEQWSKLVEDQTELLLWFTQVLEEAKYKFNRYLNIGSHGKKKS